MNDLITKSFVAQCKAFPDKVDGALERITTLQEGKELLRQGNTFQTYVRQLRAGIDIEKPIAVGVLKIKGKLGQLMPATPKEQTGRGNKVVNPVDDFSKQTIATFRKIGKNLGYIDEYADSIDDVPTQAGFVCWTEGTRHHNGESAVNWYTPKKYIEATRSVMGSIDLDPASCRFAQRVVKAYEYFTEEHDGLSREWSGNVFLNPPYKMPEIRKFVLRLCDDVASKKVKQAVLLTNNAMDTGWWQTASKLSMALCIVAGRIKFYNELGDSDSPTHGQNFLYFGTKKGQRKFAAKFSEYGRIYL